MMEYILPGAILMTLLLTAYNIPIRDIENEITFKVIKSGNYPVTRNNIAVILFMEIVHNSSKDVDISATVQQCCIYSDFGKQNCKIMSVFGEFTGDVRPNITSVATFIYLTAYPSELVGDCEVRVDSGQISVLHHTIYFNTTSKYSPISNWIFKRIYEFVFSHNEYIEVCQTQDEDYYRGCQPVNCVLKYHGSRNFFDSKQRLCVPVLNCVSKENVVYDPENNQCKNLSIKLTEEDVKVLTHTVIHNDLKPINWKTLGRVNCHHGIKKMTGLGCICKPGWTSAATNFVNINPEISVYHMCNVKAEGTYWVTNLYIVLVTVSVLCIMMLVVTAILYVRGRNTQRERYKKTHCWPEDSSFLNNCCRFFYKIKDKLKGQNRAYREDVDLSTVDTFLLASPANEF